ncbi:MAG TPA: hypothetical protein VGL39_04970 [Jatrophihabitantaceae bacterium]
MIVMRRSFSLLLVPLAAVAVLGISAAASADNGHHDKVTSRDLGAYRTATAKYHNIATALAAGYVPLTDIHGISCITEPGMGGMGVHFVNPAIIQDPAIHPGQPEALVYAPDRDGTLHLAALEFLVDKAAWNSTHTTPPALFRGHPFDETDAPNRYGLADFYSQHVWAWKANPAGPLTMWNPTVHC